MQYSSKLIAIHGLKGAGKDLTSKMLQKYVVNSATFAFGDRLKSICSAAWGVPLSTFYDEALKEKPLGGAHGDMTPRGIMTSMADAIKKQFGGDFFAKSLYTAWAQALRSQRPLIVTDLRHPVELQVCRDLGAIVIHVQRPDPGLYAPSTHVSEQGLPLAHSDLLISNSGTKADLLLQVRAKIELLWGPDALKSYPYLDSECIEFN